MNRLAMIVLVFTLGVLAILGSGGGGGGGGSVPQSEIDPPPIFESDITITYAWTNPAREIAGLRVWFGHATDFGNMFVLTVLDVVETVNFDLTLDLLSSEGDILCFKLEPVELNGTFGEQSLGVCAPALRGTQAFIDCWESLFTPDITGRCRLGTMGALEVG